MLVEDWSPIWEQTFHQFYDANTKLDLTKLLRLVGRLDSINRFNHTSWVAVATPTDRQKSVRNFCVIDVFGGVFVLSVCFLEFPVGIGACVIWQISRSNLFLFFLPNCEWFSGGICNGCGMPAENTYPSRLFFSFLFVTCIFSTCRAFPDVFHSNIPWYFLDFAFIRILELSYSVIFRSKNMCQKESLTQSSTVILFTN